MSDYDLGELVRAYDKYADERDQAGLSAEKLTFVERAIERFRREGVRTILEIGSGPGNAAAVIRDHGFEIECTDVSPREIELVQAKGIPARLLDCRELHRLGRTYDAVFSVNCLLHLPREDFPIVLQGVRDVLRESGLFILGLWGGDDFEGIFEDDHYDPKRFFMLYRQRTLLPMLMEVFQVEEYRRTIFKDDLPFHTAVMRNVSAREMT